jgi:hypothetical protein
MKETKSYSEYFRLRSITLRVFAERARGHPTETGKIKSGVAAPHLSPWAEVMAKTYGLAKPPAGNSHPDPSIRVIKIPQDLHRHSDIQRAKNACSAQSGQFTCSKTEAPGILLTYPLGRGRAVKMSTCWVRRGSALQQGQYTTRPVPIFSRLAC